MFLERNTAVNAQAELDLRARRLTERNPGYEQVLTADSPIIRGWYQQSGNGACTGAEAGYCYFGTDEKIHFTMDGPFEAGKFCREIMPARELNDCVDRMNGGFTITEDSEVNPAQNSFTVVDGKVEIPMFDGSVVKVAEDTFVEDYIAALEKEAPTETSQNMSTETVGPVGTRMPTQDTDGKTIAVNGWLLGLICGVPVAGAIALAVASKLSKRGGLAEKYGKWTD